MDPLPSVSVVVPVYNAEQTIEHCVRSLLNLDYPGERELIFVDNGSADQSARILRGFDGKIRILQEPKRGAAAARNCGIRGARYPVVAFTDSDCIVDPHWLRHVVGPLVDARVGAAGGRILAQRPCNPIEEFGERVHDAANAITLYKPPYVASANWASRKEVLENLHGFDESFLRTQDVELACRMQQAGLTLAYAPKAIVYHLNHRTYRGLFGEGFAHGLHGVALLERHRQFYESFGYRSKSLKPYRVLWRYFRNYVRGIDRQMAACHFIFDSGKRIGRLAGSMRYRSLHL
jgi:glycosyltransferase involved in cell wall biosynthesis